MLFSLLIVLISVALLALLAITLSAVIALSPCRPVVRLLGFLYRLPLFIPFIVVAQMMRTFLAKNGLMNNALVAADLVTPLDTLSWLGWKGIVITFVWKQLAFATLLICGAMAALESSQILAARNLGASRPRILFDIMLPQVLPTIGVALVLSTVTMMSVLSVPLMIGVGTPTMLTVDMAFRVNSYGDYAWRMRLAWCRWRSAARCRGFTCATACSKKAVNHESAGPRINLGMVGERAP